MYHGIKIQPNKYINGGRKEKKKKHDGGSERQRIGRRHRGLKESKLACFQSWLFSHSKDRSATHALVYPQRSFIPKRKQCQHESNGVASTARSPLTEWRTLSSSLRGEAACSPVITGKVEMTGKAACPQVRPCHLCRNELLPEREHVRGI